MTHHRCCFILLHVRQKLHRLRMPCGYILGVLAACLLLLVYVIHSSTERKFTIGHQQAGVAAYIPERGRLETFTVQNIKISYYLPKLGCPDRPWILALVISSAEDFQCRAAVRSTWASEASALGLNLTERLRVLHLIAVSRNETANNNIMRESRTHFDLAQGNFVDSYRNLTIKSIMGLHIATSACPRQPGLVIKIDCDTYLNVDNLLAFESGDNHANAIYGFLLDNDRPIRRRKNKSFISREEYDGGTYPPFIGGFFYVMTTGVAGQLYGEAARCNYLLPLEDVSVTGLLAERVGVRRYHLAGVLRRTPRVWEETFSALAVHSLTPPQMTNISKTRWRYQHS
ncbi:PREDICTED: beta-1,3-galactosyltransferase 5-like [Priapulus caudatus]|uniref:Hexosyltransferase n=1 Tax=Priapulus caudatus TaxID=37621 RepID=A0ABM1EJZ1_PRICU|nr:PREDICTED: beta-1,3-galactosyltransferase 5-like [Priapulus caudatus]